MDEEEEVGGRKARQRLEYDMQAGIEALESPPLALVGIGVLVLQPMVGDIEALMSQLQEGDIEVLV